MRLLQLKVNLLSQCLGQSSSWYSLLLLASGFTLLYTAFLIYEDEEGNIQNRLEEWWCKLDDAANTALNSHIRIIQLLAKKAHARTELMFGKELISYQSIGVSICWGMISARLTIVTLGMSSSSPQVSVIAKSLILCLIFWFISVQPRYWPKNTHGKWLLFVVTLWIAIVFVNYLGGTLANYMSPVPPAPEGSDEKIVRLGIAVIPLYTLGVLFSIPICLAFIAAFRRSLSSITRSKSNKSALTATLFQSICLLAIISLHLFTFKTLRSETDFRQHIFQVITPVMGYAYFTTLFSILMLVHIVFWAVMRRPIYSLARLGVERRKKLFAGLGFMLIGLAIPKVMEVTKTLSLDFIKSLFG